jgi:hypothetical protein
MGMAAGVDRSLVGKEEGDAMWKKALKFFP